MDDRVVRSQVRFTARGDARFAFAVAPATDLDVVDERFEVEAAGDPEVEVVTMPHGGRIHLVSAPAGDVSFTYEGRVRSTPRPVTAPDASEAILYTRPSRYCPSDHLSGFAVAEFGKEEPSIARVTEITEWVGRRVAYVAGVGTVHDSAEHTLLTGAGTCRDFAHLGVAICRALEIPARFVSVYAPGLSPMDFHAVFEANVEGGWYVFDATGLAPRSTMVRIATGRDAADTAFVTVQGEDADFLDVAVLATVDGALPMEDGSEAIRLG